MFPHYLEVARWLVLASVLFAWIALAAYLTVHLITRRTPRTSAPWPRIAVLWLLPVVGVIAHLVTSRRDAPDGRKTPRRQVDPDG